MPASMEPEHESEFLVVDAEELKIATGISKDHLSATSASHDAGRHVTVNGMNGKTNGHTFNGNNFSDSSHSPSGASASDSDAHNASSATVLSNATGDDDDTKIPGVSRQSDFPHPYSSPRHKRLRDSTFPSQTGFEDTKATPESSKLDKEVARLNEVLSDVSPEAKQKVLRDHWRGFLFENGHEGHISFVARALLKNASGSVLDRIGKDDSLFKGHILEAAIRKPVVIQQILKNADHEQLLKHVSKSVIEDLIHQTLEDVEARTLLRWLADAGRLGYKKNDVIDPVDESVIPYASPEPERLDVEMANAPNAHIHPNPNPNPNPAQQYADAQPRHPALPLQQVPQQHVSPYQQGPPPPGTYQELPSSYAAPTQRPPIPKGMMICPWCYFHFTNRSGYNYHVHKRICSKDPGNGGWKFACGICAQGFTTKQGREYHNAKALQALLYKFPDLSSRRLRLWEAFQHLSLFLRNPRSNNPLVPQLSLFLALLYTHQPLASKNLLPIFDNPHLNFHLRDLSR
ncbi:hypothetical protein G7Y89_g3942 [Cudoniella acicularis]|uniref:Uncharacterized protein n=1 Tax=Cudoniella acicularis TaxID=354080 RepID=A0A8H4W5G8_9HELO|nr:hypothetical protein G7Y89_g3942 [Cudoniella acicularis]